MTNQVKVAIHPETKAVVTKNSDKPEFGTIRVDQEVVSMENGFLNKTKRSAFINGKYSDLLSMGYSEGQSLIGRIVRKETFEPQFIGHTPKINPTTKEVVLINGKKVYFKDSYTENQSLQDELIEKVGQASEAKVTTNTLN